MTRISKANFNVIMPNFIHLLYKAITCIKREELLSVESQAKLSTLGSPSMSVLSKWKSHSLPPKKKPNEAKLVVF